MSRQYHGLSKHKIYTVWRHMMRRCYNPKDSAFYRYGGRGIVVCAEWHLFTTFFAWASSHGWEPGLELDRTINDGDYSPDNCRFVSDLVNVLNRSSYGKTSSYAGVHKDRKKYRSSLTLAGKKTHMGSFDTEEEAALARDRYIIVNNIPAPLSSLSSSLWLSK